VDKEQQHLIGKGYLSPWTCPDPPLGRLGTMWVVQKSTGKKELQSPRKYFRERDRYTLNYEDGRNLAVENALAFIEAGFGGVFSRIRARTPLTALDHTIMAHFTAAMLVRTRHMPNKMRVMFETIQRQAAKQEAAANLEPVYSEHVGKALPNIVGTSVMAGISEYARVLFGMNLSIFVTDDDAGFVTGDEPCSVCVPGALSSFLGHERVELTMPLSPQHMAYYSWRIPPQLYVAWSEGQVDRVNARTIDSCEEEFVTWKGTVREEWLHPDAESNQKSSTCGGSRLH
jgi:hypothetical protein